MLLAFIPNILDVSLFISLGGEIICFLFTTLCIKHDLRARISFNTLLIKQYMSNSAFENVFKYEVYRNLTLESISTFLMTIKLIQNLKRGI